MKPSGVCTGLPDGRAQGITCGNESVDDIYGGQFSAIYEGQCDPCNLCQKSDLKRRGSLTTALTVSRRAKAMAKGLFQPAAGEFLA